MAFQDGQSTASALTMESMSGSVASVCDRHRIARGRPADLVDFLRALGKNKHLAMDFWRAVSRMSGVPVEAGEASVATGTTEAPDWRSRQELTLEAIVRAIAGTGVSEMAAAGADAELAATHMARLLAGADIEYEIGAGRREGVTEAVRASAGFESTRVWIADEAPTPPIGDEELRRLALEPGGMGRLPPERVKPSRPGKARIVGCAVLLMVGCGAVVHAQRTGTLGRCGAWIRGVAGALDGQR